jgi:hypothetical protein
MTGRAVARIEFDLAREINTIAASVAIERDAARVSKGTPVAFDERPH